MIPLVT